MPDIRSSNASFAALSISGNNRDAEGTLCVRLYSELVSNASGTQNEGMIPSEDRPEQTSRCLPMATTAENWGRPPSSPLNLDIQLNYQVSLDVVREPCTRGMTLSFWSPPQQIL